MSIEFVTVALFGLLLTLLLLGLPVAFCVGGAALAGAWLSYGTGGAVIIDTSVLGTMRSIVLVCIPLFIFMGIVLEKSGVADDLYAMMHHWFGPFRGGLAIGTVVVCTLFAAMTAISGAATVTMGMIALPAMLKRGYQKEIALGCISAGGALGQLIPPSMLMVLYCFMANESVGRMFIGGILPGLLLAALFILYIAIRCFYQPILGPSLPPEERVSLPDKLKLTRGLILPALLIIMVLGSIFSGFATPTEASAVGAFGSILCALVKRQISWSIIKSACSQTAVTTSMVMWIVIASTAFSTIYVGSGASKLIQNVIMGLGVDRMAVLFGMQLVLFILGCFLDPTGIIMIITPVFVPVIKTLGFDTVWFGVLFVVNMEMAFLTPPYGMNLFYLKGIAPRGVTMGDIYRSIGPFVALQALGLALVIIFPQIVLFLPNLYFGKAG